MGTNGAVGVVVMGVSGCGKSSLGAALAAAEGWPFLEGDDLHPPANIARMRAGQPLGDTDRTPWLAAVAERLAGHLREGRSAVASCSALKRNYRDTLRQAGPLRFVYLPVPRDELARRMRGREHFMPLALLDSQLATLEEPGVDEDALALPPGAPDLMLAQVRAWLRRGASKPPR
jgi:gluconokinase